MTDRKTIKKAAKWGLYLIFLAIYLLLIYVFLQIAIVGGY